jgi:aspartate carbamoyltransferase catalytic subunit
VFILSLPKDSGFFMPDNKQFRKIEGNFKGKDILSLDQFNTTSLQLLFDTADKMEHIRKNTEPNDTLKGQIIALLFYEPSSRTFSSFAAAVKQLGGATLEFQGMTNSSAAKGETLEDTIRVFEAYTDAIIIRHPEVGTAAKAAEAAENTPIINAGDGIGEHPTQALLDLYTIYKKYNRLDNLTLLMTGDILNGRTIHSLLRGLALYENNTVYLLSPENLKLKREDLEAFTEKGLKLIEITKEEEIPTSADVWYWTRVQKERFTDLTEYEKLKHAFILTPPLLQKYAKKDTILMHPLPRVGEIDPEIDKDPRALYLKDEVQNGLYVRMALMQLILGKNLNS